ncbi:MAG: bifunctional DNA-formamidopyrimidine glycosylase/DNA-(apurinic or apyrimidinic site) lyase [Candidatus Dormiibacterota bacterium]
MPELPEVETIVRDLRPQLEGRAVERAWVGQPGVLRYPSPEEFEARITGRRMIHVGRHGKFMLVELDPLPSSAPAAGAELELLVVHLGMTGRLGLAEPETPPALHTHLRLLLSSGVELRMQDYRRFGRVLLGSPTELTAAGALPRLGPEPATEAQPNPESWRAFRGGLSLPEFSRILRRSRRPVKALLLDQGKIAGLGNIYCDEACFRAGVRPTAIAATLGSARRRRLYDGIGAALASAVDLRGSSIDDYRDAYGGRGEMQDQLLVYGRAGQPCVKCGRLLAKTVVAGRTTVFCRTCQR